MKDVWVLRLIHAGELKLFWCYSDKACGQTDGKNTEGCFGNAELWDYQYLLSGERECEG